MKLTKKTNSDGTVTLSWEKIPGVDGFRFYSAGVFRSDTWDAHRTSVKFSGGQEPYVVEAIVATAWTVKDTGRFPETPKPPDPPAFKKVAPRVAYKAGNSDARYCVRDFPDLKDDVATYDENGLCSSGTRSDGSPADCPTSALEIDGREYCSLPTQGDPTKNTGSWLV